MSKPPLGIHEIRKLLPHRYPMLLVDRVLEIEEAGDELVVAEKLVSANEPFFQGHFPEQPIMPGVLIIEALAQTAGLGERWRRPETRSRGVALVGVNRARFRRPVLPGDTLTLRTTTRRRRGDLFVINSVAQVLGDTVAEAEIMAAFVDWEPA
ncbi:MAG: 3-hydroxyacyl-ACP dehydratase FabZ [Deltaproteobacteria bacterium]|nr:3-hydroxyacyl-ACP dehydratase FabZ [Deltaproteobacteria bacterium]